MSDTVSRSFPLGTRVSRPRGGCVLWVELPNGYDALRLYEQARAVGIAIAPGPIFSATGRYGNCSRIAASTPWSSALERASSDWASWSPSRRRPRTPNLDNDEPLSDASRPRRTSLPRPTPSGRRRVERQRFFASRSATRVFEAARTSRWR